MLVLGAGRRRIGNRHRDRERLVGPFRAAVLHAVRHGRVVDGCLEGGERADVPLLFAVEQPLVVGELEHRRHEVVVARVLFESADEVRDRHVELARVHDRRVEQQVAHVAAHRLGLAGRHAEQHLELDAVVDAALACGEPGVGDVEEVVAGDAELHGVRALGRHRPVQHALVVRVGVLLGAVRRERPAVHGGVDVLHGEVRALHHAHLDGRPARGTPGLRPGRELLHRGERIGQVRLQHDAGLEPAQLGLVEQGREHRDRQVEVAVLLHVEVDELGRAALAARRGELVEGRELGHDLRDGLVERPHRELADDARHLDRDVVDVVAREELVGAREAPVGLGLAEHRLAEQVEVEAVARLAKRRDGGPELLGGGIEHQVADHATQHPAGDRDDDPGQHRRDEPAHADRGLEVPRQEPRREPGHVLEVAPGDAEVFGPHDAVDEPDREGEPVRVLQHAGESLGGGVDGVLGALGEPAAHEGDDAIGARPGVGGGVRHGHEGSSFTRGPRRGRAPVGLSVRCDIRSVQRMIPMDTVQ